MHELPKDIQRRVVPRWRRVKDTPSEEVTSVRQSEAPKEFQSEFEGLKAQWLTFEDVPSAAELLFAASLGATDDVVHQAAQFIIDAPGVASELKRLAMGRLPHVADSPPHEFERKHTFEISRLKRKLVDQPRNALAHVELARAYVSVGLIDKANQHIRAAIQLAPSSRFVLRSAARFDVHRGKTERSIKALESAASHDPWVAASLISLADLEGKPVRKIKSIRELLENTSNPAEQSELAAALGTLELKDAGLRKARKYFQISARDPNENVIAQLFWLSKRYGVNFDARLLDRSETFEARAHSSASASNWRPALDACARWLDNEPFAIRPAFEGGFIASEMVGDFAAAIDFAHRGLISNPKSVGLMNNLAFSLIMNGDNVSAKDWLVRARNLVSSDGEAQKTVLQATEGLLLYREGNPTEGANHYIATILKAREIKNEKLFQLAYIHFCYEELRIGHAPPFWPIDEVQKFFEGDNANKDAKAIFARMLLPMIIARRKYGMVDTNYGPPLSILAPAS